MTRTLAGSLVLHAVIVIAIACMLPAPSSHAPVATPAAPINVIDVTLAQVPPPPLRQPTIEHAHAKRSAPMRRDAAPPRTPPTVASNGLAVAEGSADALPAGDGIGDSAGPGTDAASGPVAIKTMPVPIGAHQATMPYTRDAIEARVEGNVLVDMIVDPSGKPTALQLAHGLGHGLDAIALDLARELEFQPARDTLDRPVAARITWRFHFAPPRRDSSP